MTAVAAGYSTGRTRKLYYNSATRASPSWVLIERISDVKFDKGKSTVFNVATREFEEEIQQVGSQSQPELSLTYHPIRGATDSVLDILLGTQGPDATAKEFLDADGAYTLTGVTGTRFFGKLTERPQDEALAKFADLSLKIAGVEHWESGAICDPIAFSA